jgi:hypothetical protein
LEFRERAQLKKITQSWHGRQGELLEDVSREDHGMFGAAITAGLANGGGILCGKVAKLRNRCERNLWLVPEGQGEVS